MVVVASEAQVDRLRRAIYRDHLIEVPYRNEKLSVIDFVHVVDVSPVLGFDPLPGIVGIMVFEFPAPRHLLPRAIIDEYAVVTRWAGIVVDPRDEEFVAVDQVDIVDVGTVETFGPDPFFTLAIELVDHGLALDGIYDE